MLSGVPIASRNAGACSWSVIGQKAPCKRTRWKHVLLRKHMLHEPSDTRGARAVRLALLGLCLLCACHSTATRVRAPMFVGTPVIVSLRPEIAALHALGAPTPAVRRLQLAVRVTANGKSLGESTERVARRPPGFGEYVERGGYRAQAGRCMLSSRNQGVAI